ncbi:MAG: hypothetical protein ABT11_04055 [Novosphingobium sp. SCN 66-18]|nr:MAG: hypothetical protein ABT11_04055 [Novosphingobium sp. SCN 66-18]
MADEQRLIDYTVPPLAYVDPAHILLFGTSAGAGVNVLASALVARQADGVFYADRNVAGNHTLQVRNYDASGAAASRLVLATGSPNSYVIFDAVNGSYRSISNGAGIAPAYDYADQHYFMTRAGVLQMSLPDTSNAIFGAGALWVASNKLVVQHDGSNGYIRAQTGGLYLGSGGANRWGINDATFYPILDNTYALCWAGARATQVFAATGTINTSDEREKDWRGAPNDAELRAARRIAGEIGVYRWLDAVAAKGDKARLHIGVRAQRVWAIMAEEGLVDPIGADGRPGETPYAFLCWDEWGDVWEDEYEDVTVSHPVLVGEKVSSVLGADGKPIREPVFKDQEQKSRVATGNKVLVTAAGNRFGLRVDQLALFLIAAQEQRLAALEAA